MSTHRLALLLAAAVLTTASVAALVAGLVSGLISSGVAVNGLMMSTAVMWSAWARSGHLERIAKQQQFDSAVRAFENEQAPRPLRPVR